MRYICAIITLLQKKLMLREQEGSVTKLSVDSSQVGSNPSPSDADGDLGHLTSYLWSSVPPLPSGA